MTEIDRRALITVAGASLLVAGCKEDKPAAEATPSPGPTGNQSGTCDIFGQAVSADAPTKLGNVRDFRPERICIVLLRFENAGSLIARRSYIPYVAGAADRVAKIEAELGLLSAGTSASDYRQDVDPINLNGQRLLVVYIDHTPSEARFKVGTTPQQEYDHTLRFTKYSGKGTTVLIKENHAFVNADKIDLPNLRGKLALSLEFWNTDENGDKIDGTRRPYRYSLNIQLETASPSVDTQGNPMTRWVPVIIDPDTGNMGVEP